MKELVLSGVVACAFLLVTCAAGARALDDGYRTGTITGVSRQDTYPSLAGENPTDAPLRARVYMYDITIQLNCDIYVGRYESELKYLPSAFSPDHEIDVRLHKHILYVSLPFDDEDVMMGIVGHRHVKSGVCAEAASSKNHFDTASKTR